MHHLATDPTPIGGGNIKERLQPTDGAGRVAALAEARGVVRDALASVRNLEHLLRSPRVSARAISQLIPGLKGACDPLAMSVDQILTQVRGMTSEPVDAATAELEAFMPAWWGDCAPRSINDRGPRSTPKVGSPSRTRSYSSAPS
jgi:hypothetical protein